MDLAKKFLGAAIDMALSSVATALVGEQRNAVQRKQDKLLPEKKPSRGEKRTWVGPKATTSSDDVSCRPTSRSWRANKNNSASSSKGRGGPVFVEDCDDDDDDPYQIVAYQMLGKVDNCETGQMFKNADDKYTPRGRNHRKSSKRKPTREERQPASETRQLV